MALAARQHGVITRAQLRLAEVRALLTRAGFTFVEVS